MTTTTAQQRANARDTFITYDDEAKPSDWRRWVELLEGDHKGLAKVGIEVWRGAGGYTEIGDLPTSTKEGNPVELPGDVAQLDPTKIAESAWKICERHHRRHAYERYRIVLYYQRKKGVEPTKGDAVAIKFRDGQSEGAEMALDPSGVAIKALQAENTNLRKWCGELLGGQVSMAQACTANMMTGLRIAQVAVQEREQASDHYANLKTQASPEDWNKRVQTVVGGIVQTVDRLSKFTASSGWGMAAPGAQPPPPNGAPSPNAEGGSTATSPKAQEGCREFFEALNGEQKDKLRDGFPPGAFNAIFEVLHGDAAQFHHDLPALRVLLQEHVGLLMQVLTTEQLAEIQRVTA